jgi:pimeloyl-ACP methyl ester carboxylesterase
MGLGTGKTEHSGPRDTARKDGHWGFTGEAKEFATRARRRDEKELLRREDWKLMREILREDGDIDRYLADLARPGAVTAALNWYRANLSPQRELEQGPSLPAVSAPTLGLWSSGDNYLTEERMLSSGEHVGGPWRYERFEGASHWMQLDAPDRLNELLLEFLA